MQNTKIACPNCSSTNTRKHTKRKNKRQTVQIYYCKDCSKYFSDNAKRITNKTYSPLLILNAISLYNLGYTQNNVSKLISQKFKIRIPQRTISQWLNQYKEICTYSKLRKKAIKLYKPKNIIFKKPLQHQQVYNFQYHKAKLEILFKDIKYNNEFINSSKFYEPIKQYLEKIPTNKFPHHIFQPKQNQDEKLEELSRSSQIKFETLDFIKAKKQNLANKLASLSLMLAESNKDRHNAIQNFMLINDSTTIAIEIPVYLTKDDMIYFKKKGFILSFATSAFGNNTATNKKLCNIGIGTPHAELRVSEESTKKSTTNLSSADAEIEKIKDNDKNNLQSSDAVIAQIKNNDNKNIEIAKDNLNDKNKLLIKTPITGHIDILQIRNGLIHILDYKPEANKINPTDQLTIYALALASRTKLDLYSFKCAWFDENNYYEFFPLHAVYSKNQSISFCLS